MDSTSSFLICPLSISTAQPGFGLSHPSTEPPKSLWPGLLSAVDLANTHFHLFSPFPTSQPCGSSNTQDWPLCHLLPSREAHTPYLIPYLTFKALQGVSPPSLSHLIFHESPLSTQYFRESKPLLSHLLVSSSHRCMARLQDSIQTPPFSGSLDRLFSEIPQLHSLCVPESKAWRTGSSVFNLLGK